METPKSIHVHRILPSKPSIFWGIPMTMETPKSPMITQKIIEPSLHFLSHYGAEHTGVGVPYMGVSKLWLVSGKIPIVQLDFNGIIAYDELETSKD